MKKETWHSDWYIITLKYSALQLSGAYTESQRNGSFEVLALGFTLGNGSGTDFGVSQCIPMSPCRCRLMLGVFIPLAMWNYLEACCTNGFNFLTI